MQIHYTNMLMQYAVSLDGCDNFYEQNDIFAQNREVFCGYTEVVLTSTNNLYMFSRK